MFFISVAIAVDPALGVLGMSCSSVETSMCDEVDLDRRLHGRNRRATARVRLQPRVEHDAVGMLLLELGRALLLVHLPQLVVLAVRVELLVDAPKVLAIVRVTSEMSVTTSTGVGDDVVVEGEDDGSSSSLTRCGGVSMHVPCIQRTKARVDSTTDLTILASTLLISGSGGEIAPRARRERGDAEERRRLVPGATAALVLVGAMSSGRS